MLEGSDRRSTYDRKSSGPFGWRVRVRESVKVKGLVMAIAVVTVIAMTLVFPDEA